MKETTKKILTFIKHFSKEILIGLILAVIAAVAIDVYKSEIHKNNIEANKKAIATVLVYGKEGNLLGQGSGVFINATGLLVTNFHVIEGTDISKTVAKLSTGAQYSLRNLRGLDKKLDIALLQFEGTETPHVKKLGDSDQLLSGERVIAIGSPLGQENSVSDGIIANPARELLGLKFIQFTAPISPGSSGGGLFNKDGKTIIGIMRAALQDEKREAQNLNFAIPINLVKNILSGSERKLVEQSADYYYSLGQIEENHGNSDKAIEYYQKAISIDSRYADAYISLGSIYYDKGEYDLEVNNFEKAVTIDPDKYEYLYYLGTAYEDTHQYDKAVKAYREVLRIKRDDKDTLHDFAILLIADGDCDQAREYISRLKALDTGQAKKLELLIARTRCR
ncbi:MAG: trypsin-like peptidase domain-containing protein [Thermodesulfobacteriota bacterium]